MGAISSALFYVSQSITSSTTAYTKFIVLEEAAINE